MDIQAKEIISGHLKELQIALMAEIQSHFGSEQTILAAMVRPVLVYNTPGKDKACLMDRSSSSKKKLSLTLQQQEKQSNRKSIILANGMNQTQKTQLFYSATNKRPNTIHEDDKNSELVSLKLVGDSLKKRDWDEIISNASQPGNRTQFQGRKINKLIDLQ